MDFLSHVNDSPSWPRDPWGGNTYHKLKFYANDGDLLMQRNSADASQAQAQDLWTY